MLLPFALLMAFDGYYMENTNPKENIKIFGELFFPNLGAFFVNFGMKIVFYFVLFCFVLFFFLRF